MQCMPKPKSKTKDQIATEAMHVFWRFGFNGTSMDTLVRETGSSRHAIYSECGGKDALFQQSLDMYQQLVVDPAFLQVEATDADLQTIAAYFETQISAAEDAGAPYPGCLVANTMTETGPHSADALQAVNHHNERLKAGFFNALKNSASDDRQISESVLRELASFLTISTQGLWAFSRSVKNVQPLRNYAANLMQIIQERIAK